MKEATFAEMMAQLEETVSRLENGECTLEESMELFEKGTALVRTLNRKLCDAEQKITELSAENPEKQEDDAQ